MDFDEVLVKIQDDMLELVDKLGADASVEVTGEVDENSGEMVVNVDFSGDELGYMIGAKGRHLRSLQYIYSILLNNKYEVESGERFFVHMDVSGYREEREEEVRRLAEKAADDARLLGEYVDMDPMNPADRRVVHTELSKYDDIVTESYGEGRDRYVRVIPMDEDKIVSPDVTGEDEESESE